MHGCRSVVELLEHPQAAVEEIVVAVEVAEVGGGDGEEGVEAGQVRLQSLIWPHQVAVVKQI